MSELTNLTHEVERLTGKQIIPVQFDRRLYYTPLAILVLLVIVRPSFLYSDKKFKVTRLLLYTVLISAFILCGVYVYKYRLFF